MFAMRRRLFWCFCVLLTISSLEAQPSCETDAQCSEFNFCQKVSFHCVPCINCREYNRAPKDICVKNVDDCGICLMGYEESASSFCTLPSGSANVPLYAVILLAISAVIAIAVLLYLLVIKPHFFKEERAVHVNVPPSPVSVPVPTETPAEPSPMTSSRLQNNNYEPVRPTSPPQELFCKPYFDEPPFNPMFRKDSLHLRQQRETNFNQEAQVYEQPNYVQAPPSYEEATSEDTHEPIIDDEATRESPWTPAIDEHEQPSSLSALLSEALNKDLVQSPTAQNNTSTSQPTMILTVLNENNDVRVRIPVSEDNPITEGLRRTYDLRTSLARTASSGSRGRNTETTQQGDDLTSNATQMSS